MPKCRRLIFIRSQIGIKMGMVISKMGVASITHPMINSTNIIMKYNTARLSEMLVKVESTVWGTRA